MPACCQDAAYVCGNAMFMKTHYDLIVIGGGVLGTFHAYEALMQGQRVCLIDKNITPQGSSVQNFGQAVPSGFGVKWQRYGRKSLEIYKHIQSKFDITVRNNGSIYLASNEEEMTLLEELAVINRGQDYSSQLLSAEACRNRYPGLRADYCVGGLFFPEEITLEPREAISRIHQYLREQTALDLYNNTLVIGIDSSDSEVWLRSSDGRSFSGERVLICNGYEFQLLFPEIFAQSDIELVKLQMLLLETQPTQRIPGSILTGLTIRRYESFKECPSYAAIKAKEDPEAYARKWGVHILFKQTPEGSIILGDSHEYADVNQPELLGRELREDLNQFMIAEARKIFDLQTWAVRETWFGMYAQCKTRDIFRHYVDDRVLILTGIGGKGMTASAGYAHYEPIFQ